MQTPIRLSPRQLEVASLIAEAKTAKEIAQALHVSDMTVERHVYQIGQIMHGGNFGPGLKVRIAVAYVRGEIVAE